MSSLDTWDKESVQKKFFAHIVNRRGSEVVLSDMMDVLGIQKSAAYKRLQGKTALSALELVQLSEHFNVSLDIIFQPQRYISFQHPFTEAQSSTSFLDKFTYFLKPLTSPNFQELIYLANELPVFYYFSHKYIFNFLISIWNHVHWTDQKLTIRENQSVTNHIESIRKDITYYYNYHPVTEIWNANMMANLYQQIIFCVTMQAFEDRMYIDRLIKDIDNLLNNLYEICQYNPEEERPHKRKIYLNEFGSYLNLGLYDSGKIKSLFIGYDIPQFLVSHNSEFIDYSRQWVQKIKNRSIPISGEGYQMKELFFNRMKADFELFKERVDNLMVIYYKE